MERNQGSQQGMTLVEVICSLAILGIIIAPTAAFFANSFKTNNLAKEQLEANQLAQKYMEEYKSKSFSDLITEFSPFDPTTHKSTISLPPETLGFDQFTTDVELTQTNNFTSTDITIPWTYYGQTLLLSVNGTGTAFTFLDATYPCSSDPITVMLKQDGGPSSNITIELENRSSKTLQVTKLTTDNYLSLNPIQGKITMISQNGEATQGSIDQETGLPITVTVSCQKNGIELATAKLSQIKMTK
ncbi:MAG: type II secretion system protein [Desulfosporosinus sp.]|nr:type II secretion system protein [Desulfosporosinus sp.]